MVYAPVVLFVFNRPQHMARMIAALQANELAQETPLFVFCDGARHAGEEELVREVREQAHALTGFKSVTVIERDHNFGLANSIINGVTRLCREYGRVIVLEDDLITSKDFLRFMNQGLDLYANEERVASIHGYAYPTENHDAPESYFLRGADCWGWATWDRAWKHFEPDGYKLMRGLKHRRLRYQFDYDGNSSFIRMLRNQIKGKNQSWAIRWHASAFLKDMLTLYPRQSLVANLGFDDSGTHCSEADYYATQLGVAPQQLKKISIEENALTRIAVINFFDKVRRQHANTLFRRARLFVIKQMHKLFDL